MPVQYGPGRKKMSANYNELGQGSTYAHTKEKFGKEKAEKQRIAIMLNASRKPADYKGKSNG